MTGRRVSGIVMTVLGFIGVLGSLIVGNVPYSQQGIQYCGSWFSSLGGQTIGQSFIDGLSGGACTAYAHRMGFLTVLILVISVVLLIVGVIMITAGKRRQPPFVVVTPTVSGAGGQTTLPAGWYPDYEQPARQRWWDGATWTQHVHDPAGSPEAGPGA